MDVRNCRGCGRLFNFVQGVNYLCPACMDELEEKFKIAKDFIRKNGSAGIMEVAEAADVKRQQVERWVREERLVFSDDSPVGIDCEGCGATIKSGRFCEACKNSMSNSLSNLYKEEKPKKIEPEKKTAKENRMRFLK